MIYLGQGGYFYGTDIFSDSTIHWNGTNTLTITSIADANALSYQVIITNSSGAVTSSPATFASTHATGGSARMLTEGTTIW